MTQNQYDYIIIGAGGWTSPLTPLLKERGMCCSKNKAPAWSTRAGGD